MRHVHSQRRQDRDIECQFRTNRKETVFLQCVCAVPKVCAKKKQKFGHVGQEGRESKAKKEGLHHVREEEKSLCFGALLLVV